MQGGHLSSLDQRNCQLIIEERRPQMPGTSKSLSHYKGALCAYQSMSSTLGQALYHHNLHFLLVQSLRLTRGKSFGSFWDFPKHAKSWICVQLQMCRQPSRFPGICCSFSTLLMAISFQTFFFCPNCFLHLRHSSQLTTTSD